MKRAFTALLLLVAVVSTALAQTTTKPAENGSGLLVPEFTLSIPVVLFLVAMLRRLLPELDSRVWAWATLAVGVVVAVLCQVMGVLQTTWTETLVNGVMVGGGAVLGYDGLLKPLVRRFVGTK
jgi:hypothetical protein